MIVVKIFEAEIGLDLDLLKVIWQVLKNFWNSSINLDVDLYRSTFRINQVQFAVLIIRLRYLDLDLFSFCNLAE